MTNPPMEIKITREEAKYFDKPDTIGINVSGTETRRLTKEEKEMLSKEQNSLFPRLLTEEDMKNIEQINRTKKAMNLEPPRWLSDCHSAPVTGMDPKDSLDVPVMCSKCLKVCAVKWNHEVDNYVATLSPSNQQGVFHEKKVSCTCKRGKCVADDEQWENASGGIGVKAIIDSLDVDKPIFKHDPRCTVRMCVCGTEKTNEEWWKIMLTDLTIKDEVGIDGDFPIKVILEEHVATLILEAQKRERERFARIVKEVEKVNDSNGRFNACQEILSLLNY